MSDVKSPALPEPKPTKPAIIVADDHALFRAGLRVMLQDDFPAYEVVEAPDLEQALERASVAPSIALFVIDLAMPGMNGAASLAALCDVFPDTAVAVMPARPRWSLLNMTCTELAIIRIARRKS